MAEQTIQTATESQDSNNVGNLIDLSESNVGADENSKDFFEALEQQSNSMIYDDSPQQTTSESSGNNTPVASPVNTVENAPDNNGVENLQKRYSASSKEAKRLNGRLSELEPYVPILDAMKEDPNLITHVRNYFEGGGNTPTSMKEQLNLDEDFAFDSVDAFDNPDSDSAKVLNATVDGLVQRRLNDFTKTQQTENQRLTQEASFREKYEMNGEQWDDLIGFAKNKKLDLEDIYYLKNRDGREKNIKRAAQEEVTKQMENVRQRPQSLSSSGSAPSPEKSPDDEVFDTLLGGESINRLLG
tara:strand:+ start:648 stop:1547 length:900 start_codon:yes stop_codon:yes gene_type:complete